MNHTVVGLFNDNPQIRRAVDGLEAIGISSENISVGRTKGVSGYVKDDPSEPQEWVGTNNITDNNLIRFFKSLFSDECDETSDSYAKIANSGHSVVTVLTASDEEAERAAHVLEECGALSVDDVEDGRVTASGRSRSAPIEPMAGGGEHAAPPISDDRMPENREGDARQDRLRSPIIARNVSDDRRLQEPDDLSDNDPDHNRNRPGASGF